MGYEIFPDPSEAAIQEAFKNTWVLLFTRSVVYPNGKKKLLSIVLKNLEAKVLNIFYQNRSIQTC